MMPDIDGKESAARVIPDMQYDRSAYMARGRLALQTAQKQNRAAVGTATR
jgi:hypothetical protein